MLTYVLGHVYPLLIITALDHVQEPSLVAETKRSLYWDEQIAALDKGVANLSVNGTL